MTSPTPRRITVEVSELEHALLATLNDAGDVTSVIHQLIDHAQQGVYRPGAWEREWLEQVFGDDWQQRLEDGDPYGRPNCEHCFQRPRGFVPKQ